MLPVMIYALQEEARESLIGEMSRQAREMKIPMQVVMSSENISEIVKTLEDTTGISVLLIQVGVVEGKIDHRPIELGRMALRNNRDHYIVYLLQNAAMMEKAAILCSRHFGMLVCPPKENLVKATCKRILTDYASIMEPEQEEETDWLVVQNGRAYQRIAIQEIDYVEALNKKLNIYLQDSVITVYDTLAELSDQLGDRFYRAHRSFLVNKSRIKRVNFANLEIELQSGSRVPLARSKRQEGKTLIEELGGMSNAG